MTGTTVRTVALRAAAALSMCVMPVSSTAFAQSATEIQILRLEIEALKQRLSALQQEINALKSQQTRLLTRQPAPSTTPPPALGNIVLRLDKAPIRGEASARVTLVEISDFECPFCGRYFTQTSSSIVKNYVQGGRIRLAFVNYPIASHRNAFKAAEAGACAADQGKFWEMYDRLFSNQRQLLATTLPTHGAAVGVNADRFRECLDSSAHAADIRNDVTMAQRAGVTATPTFFVGVLDPTTKSFKVSEKIVGAKPYAVFQQALDAALARK